MSEYEAPTRCLRPITCGCYRRERSGGRRWQHACEQMTAVSSSPRQRQEGCRPVGRHHQLLLVCSTVTVKHSCSPPTQYQTPNISTTLNFQIQDHVFFLIQSIETERKKRIFFLPEVLLQDQWMVMNTEALSGEDGGQEELNSA